MHRLSLVALLSLTWLAAPAAQASDELPADVHGGYVASGLLLGGAVATGVVAVTQWGGLIGVQNSLYQGGHHSLELDGFIDEGNGYMLRGIVFTSIAGVTLVASVINLACTADRHDKWKQEQASRLLPRRRARLTALALAPDPTGGLHAAMELRW